MDGLVLWQYHSGSCGDCEVKVCKVYDGRDM